MCNIISIISLCLLNEPRRTPKENQSNHMSLSYSRVCITESLSTVSTVRQVLTSIANGQVAKHRHWEERKAEYKHKTVEAGHPNY